MITLFIGVIMALTLVLSDAGMVITAKAEGGVTLKLHYHREDGDYAAWD